MKTLSIVQDLQLEIKVIVMILLELLEKSEKEGLSTKHHKQQSQVKNKKVQQHPIDYSCKMRY